MFGFGLFCFNTLLDAAIWDIEDSPEPIHIKGPGTPVLVGSVA